MKSVKFFALFLSLSLLLAGCAAEETAATASPTASPAASPEAGQEPDESETPQEGELPASGLPGLYTQAEMENLVFGRIEALSEETVTLALLAPANLPEEAPEDLPEDAPELPENLPQEMVFDPESLEETGETAEYAVEEIMGALQGEGELAQGEILLLELDEEGAVVSASLAAEMPEAPEAPETAEAAETAETAEAADETERA